MKSATDVGTKVAQGSITQAAAQSLAAQAKTVVDDCAAIGQ